MREEEKGERTNCFCVLQNPFVRLRALWNFCPLVVETIFAKKAQETDRQMGQSVGVMLPSALGTLQTGYKVAIWPTVK